MVLIFSNYMRQLYAYIESIRLSMVHGPTRPYHQNASNIPNADGFMAGSEAGCVAWCVAGCVSSTAVLCASHRIYVVAWMTGTGPLSAVRVKCWRRSRRQLLKISYLVFEEFSNVQATYGFSRHLSSVDLPFCRPFYERPHLIPCHVHVSSLRPPQASPS